MSNAARGEEAERFVVSHVPCPSCAHELRALPRGYPLYDIDCTRCLFRAQVKRVLARPRSRIRGASWEVMQHHLKTGHLIPPIFACFGWRSDAVAPESIYFFPFIPATHLKVRVLSANHKTPGRRMTEYERMLELPHMVVWPR